MSQAFILDASVTMSWFLEDESDAYSEAVKHAFAQGARPVVPALWAIETTHVLLRADRRGRVSSIKALEVLALLKELPVEIDKTDSHTVFGRLVAGEISRIERLRRDLSRVGHSSRAAFGSTGFRV